MNAACGLIPTLSAHPPPSVFQLKCLKTAEFAHNNFEVTRGRILSMHWPLGFCESGIGNWNLGIVGWYLLQPGAGTISPVIISSLITGGSVGGGGQTSESIISSVTLMIPTRSGGSVREDLRNEKVMVRKRADYRRVN